MKKFAVIATFAVLAACGQAPKEEPAAEETAAAEPAAMVTANGSAAGTYTVTAADGSAGGTSVLNADGTYTDTGADGTVTEGTWAVTDGKTCFTTKEEGAKPVCWTEAAPAADGSFTATSDSGETVTVKPAASAEPAAN